MEHRIQTWRVMSAVGLIICALALLFTSSAERVLAAAPTQGGSVIAVDQKTRSFTCRLKTGKDWNCKTTEKTMFMVGKTKASWSDIKKGVMVECIFHHEGQAAVADSIQIDRQAAQPLKD
jgi:Cu/Ag efflux protein CusF